MIENLPVWSLYPDWKDGMTETLEFLTSVGESMSAIEQRRGLRLTPRQYFELSYVLKGPDRTHFDLLTMRAGGSACYLPLWHDVELLPTAFSAGSTAITVQTTYTEFMNCNAVFIGSARNYEVVEIVGRADTLITLTSGLVNDWPKGTRVVPMKKVRLDSQPSTTRHTEVVHTARVKFCSLEDNRTDAEPPLNMFGLQYVLEEDPNEVQDLTYTYERLISTLDNTMGIPAMSDVTGRVMQQFSWWRKGRAATHALRGLFYSLDGRRVPVWVPTIYADFEPVAMLHAGDLAIDVRQCGFTALGGPGPQREYVLIQTLGGTRYYHKITSSVILGSGDERLFIATPIEADIPLSRLNRISFLVLCRLDGDSIEMLHHTATRGMTTTVAVFRSAAAKDGIESLYEVPPGIVPATVCLSDFTWFNSTFDIRYGSYTDRLDQYGNYYITSGFGSRLIEIYNPNGVLLHTYDTQQLGDAINSWAGSGVFVTNPGYYECFGFPIRQGKYFLAHLRTTGSTVGVFDKWWVLLEPALDGSLTVRGAVVNHNLTGPPYTNTTHAYDVFDDESAILVEAYFALGSWTACLLVLPSINEFLAGTYNGGWPGLAPYAIPTTMLYPIGNSATLSDKLLIITPGDHSDLFGFKLPGIGRELLYVYINRSYMDYVASGGVFSCPEIRDNIQPYYPNGCILRIPLGDLSSFSDIASTTVFGPYKGRATEDYTIDNPDWRDADGGPAVPFLDEYTYLSDGTVGGSDVYSYQVSVQLRTNGKYWVIFLMTGYDDAIHRGTGGVLAWSSPVYAKVRVFEYDPAYEIGTQIFEHVCALHTDIDIPRTPFVMGNDLHLIAEIVETESTGTVVLHGPIYKTAFCRFALPEAV